MRLAPEPAAVAEWTTPYKIDPFATSVEQNLDLLLKVDAEMRAVAGVTLSETGMNFQREESWFLSSEGADIHQTKYSTGAGYTAYAFAGAEIQKRSYPNSFGGQWQNRGYELIEEMKLVENARRVGGRSGCTASGGAMSGGRGHDHSGWLATGIADSRIDWASD